MGRPDQQAQHVCSSCELSAPTIRTSVSYAKNAKNTTIRFFCQCSGSDLCSRECGSLNLRLTRASFTHQARWRMCSEGMLAKMITSRSFFGEILSSFTDVLYGEHAGRSTTPTTNNNTNTNTHQQQQHWRLTQACPLFFVFALVKWTLASSPCLELQSVESSDDCAHGGDMSSSRSLPPLPRFSTTPHEDRRPGPRRRRARSSLYDEEPGGRRACQPGRAAVATGAGSEAHRVLPHGADPR